MYDFHHSFIKKHFDAKLLFTDTDSLTYEIKSKDVYEEPFKHKHLFHFNNYQKDSKVFDPTNRNVIGIMKEVFEEKAIDEFVALESKIVCFKWWYSYAYLFSWRHRFTHIIEIPKDSHKMKRFSQLRKI